MAETSTPGGGHGENPAEAVRLTVLIILYRTPELLRRALEALRAHPPGVPYEILVIDNGPAEEGGAQVCQGIPHCRYRPSGKNLGYARAINQGLRLSRSPLVLVMNPDVFVTPGAVDRLIEVMDEDPRVGIAGPKLLNPDGTLQYSCRSFYTVGTLLLRRTFLGRLFPNHRLLREHLLTDWDHGARRDVDWMLGACLMVRRTMVEDVGGMDERFFLYFEDVDWCYRARQRGWRVLYVPEAVMYHHHRRESAKGLLSPGMRRHLESVFRYYEKWSLLLYVLKLKTFQIRTLVIGLFDLVMVTLAFIAAYSLRLLFSGLFARPLFGLGDYLRFLLFGDVVALLAFISFGLYRPRAWFDRFHGWWQLARAMIAVSLIMMASTFLMQARIYSRVIVVLYFPLALLFVGMGRELLRRFVLRIKRQGLQLKRLLFVGPHERLDALRRRLGTRGGAGITPIFLPFDALSRHPSGERLDPARELVRAVERERIGEVLVFETPETRRLLEETLEELARRGLPVGFVPEGQGLFVPGRRIESLFGLAVLPLGGRQRTRVGSLAKRLLDLAVSLPLLVAGAPLHLLQLVLLGRGPRLTGEERLGRRGRPLLLRRYARRTPLTRALRWMELYPTLPHVVSGRMSLVGIYPFPPGRWHALAGDGREAMPDAPPGLVGPWGRDLWAPGDDLERLAANRRYVRRWSLEGDLRTLLDRGWTAASTLPPGDLRSL